MFGLGKRHDTDNGRIEAAVVELRAELAELRKRVVACEAEVAETSATALRHLKAARERERRALKDGDGAQGPPREASDSATPAPRPSKPEWGARRRIAARKLGITAEEFLKGTNGDAA